MPDVEPSAANAYQVAPTITFNRARWNAVMASIAARLAARELLEASFEALIADGTQAALDLIQVNVGPQLETLTQQIAALEEQLEDIIGGGTAPNALLLGGQFPSFYLALANATGTLPVSQVSGVDALIAAAVASLVNAAPSQLDTLKELSDALGGDQAFAATMAAALGNRLRFDAAQALTGPQIAQALGNLGVSDFIKGLLNDADAANALTTLGATGVGRGLLTAADVGAQRALLGVEHVIGLYTATAAVDLQISLPADYEKFILEYQGYVGGTVDEMAMRVSYDGATFYQAAGSYIFTTAFSTGTVNGSISQNLTLFDLLSIDPPNDVTKADGRIDIRPGSASESFRIEGSGGGFSAANASMTKYSFTGTVNGGTARVQKIKLFNPTGAISGRFILKGVKF